MKPTPILFISDSPDLPTGLGRICKDVSIVASSLPEFRVGVLGRGGQGTRQLPYQQYCFPETDHDWGASRLPKVWGDFAQGQPGVIMTIWDPSRIRYLVDNAPGIVTEMLNNNRVQLWGYMALDAAGPGNKLPGVLTDTIMRFDRILCYGLWSEGLVKRSMNRDNIDWLPHGISLKTFYPRDRVAARLGIFNPEDQVVGMVATNQLRKDWGLAFMVIAELKRNHPKIKFWVHIDTEIRHWNILALIDDFELRENVVVTKQGDLSNDQLAAMYSACDVTILPSSEGFGYPIVESIACGTPCIHSDYAGGAELVTYPNGLVKPSGWRLEGTYNSFRPEWDMMDWIAAVEYWLDPENRLESKELIRTIEHLDWWLLAEPWKKWFREGLSNGRTQI